MFLKRYSKILLDFKINKHCMKIFLVVLFFNYLNNYFGTKLHLIKNLKDSSIIKIVHEKDHVLMFSYIRL